MPGSNDVYCLGSNVSVWAMPPAIQRRIRLSARGAIFVLDASSRASDPASAARAAVPEARRKLRRERPARIARSMLCSSRCMTASILLLPGGVLSAPGRRGGVRDIKVEIPATPLEPPDRSTSALSAFIRVHLRPDVLFFRPNAKTKTPYWPQMNANKNKQDGSFPEADEVYKAAAVKLVAAAARHDVDGAGGGDAGGEIEVDAGNLELLDDFLGEVLLRPAIHGIVDARAIHRDARAVRSEARR